MPGMPPAAESWRREDEAVCVSHPAAGGPAEAGPGGGAEADYWQEKLDRLLLDLLRNHQALIPFGERYP